MATQGDVISDFPVDEDTAGFRLALNNGYPTCPAIVVADYTNGFGDVRLFLNSAAIPPVLRNVALPTGASFTADEVAAAEAPAAKSTK